MANNKRVLLKVIYFDESSALDYIDIEHKGRATKKKTKETTGKAGSGIEVSATTPKLLGFFRAGAKINASAEAQRLVNNQVTNTILTDFLNEAEKKRRYRYFEGYGLSIFKDSTTFFKTLSPVAKALKGDFFVGTEEQAMNLEISKIGSIVEGVQGYSEFIATSNSKRFVFRFNDLAFRNNYRLLDMPKMSMSFYGVKVGEVDESELSFNSLYEQKGELLDPQDMVDRHRSSPQESQKLEVYDILLAGVFKNDEK